MNVYLKYTPLSQDICSILDKYSDYSLENAIKILNKKLQIRSIVNIKDITMIDIIFRFTSLGYIGIYIPTVRSIINKRICEMIIYDKLHDFITIQTLNHLTYYFIKSKTGMTCCIDCLFEYKVK